MPTQNVNAMAQYAMQNGNTRSQANNGQKTDWEKMLAMLAMSGKMDWQTMLGFGLGKLLRGGYDTWKGNYDARGYINDYLAGASPEEREKALQRLEQNNPKQYERLMNNAQKKGYDWAGGVPAQVDTAQSDLSEVNPNARAVLRAKEGLFGNPSNFQSENLPVVDAPFQQLDYSFEDKDKWNMQDYIKRMGWNGNAY